MNPDKNQRRISIDQASMEEWDRAAQIWMLEEAKAEVEAETRALLASADQDFQRFMARLLAD